MDDHLLEEHLRKFKLRSMNQGFKQDLKQALLSEIGGTRAPFNRLALTNALLALLLFGLLVWDVEMPRISHAPPVPFSASTGCESIYPYLVSILDRSRTVPPGDIKKKFEEAEL